MSIILYDLPSRPPCKSWSGNTLKGRAVLNFKGLDYKTEWIEYPDIAPTFKAVGIPPNEPPAMFEYSVPTIKMADGTYVMDSRKIAEAIEKVHPTPSLLLDSPSLLKVGAVMNKIMPILSPIYMPAVGINLLNPPSEEHFRRTRESKVGMTLEEFRDSPKGGDAAWNAATPHIKELAALLKEKSDGPFFEGQEPGFADVMIVTWIRFFEILGQEKKILTIDNAFSDVYKAGKKWVERDDY